MNNDTQIAAHMALVDEFATTTAVVAVGRDRALDTRSQTAEAIEARAAVEASARKLAAAPTERCPYCDDTGDVHSIEGEWRGTCNCPAGKPEQAAPEADALYFDAAMPPVVVRPLTASPTAQPSEPVGDEQLDFLSMTDAQVDDELKRLGIDPVLAGEMGASAVARALSSYTCRLCGHSTPHTHTPEEIIIFRNGMKAARSTPPPAPVLLSDAEIDEVYYEYAFRTAPDIPGIVWRRGFVRAIEQAIGRASREAK